MSDTFSFIATSAFGIESVVKSELIRLGIKELTAENGRVLFRGTAEEGVRAAMWLRSADRLFLDFGRFHAATFDELFEGIKALPWHELLPKDASFPVNAKSVQSTLFSLSDIQSITKKSIVEKLKLCYNIPWFEETGPVFPVDIGILKDTVTVAVDMCGQGLHKRGYRKLTGNAPIRETTAAALILLSRYHPDRVFMDPLCGTGTIPIEAAMIGQNIAPGIKHTFTAENWPLFGHDVWDAARSDAIDAKNDRKMVIFASDIDEEAISMAKYHAKAAGVTGIRFEVRDIADVNVREQYGFAICNPPYGKRLGESDEYCASLYRTMGRVFDRMDTWGLYVICAYPWFEKYFGKKAPIRRKLYSGKIQCQYYQYPGPKPPWLNKTVTMDKP